LKHLTKDAEIKVMQAKNKMNRYFSHMGAKNKFTKNQPLKSNDSHSYQMDNSVYASEG
jgi:hypothetical protein